MPFVTNRGVRIHYEVEGETTRPVIVLQHGSSGNLTNWRSFGYVDALKNDYRLILVDARGHGESDKPHDPEAYSQELFAADYLAILDELGIKEAHYWGYSMGGRIGYRCIARYAIDRFYSMILGGASPYPITTDEEKKELSERLAELKIAIDDGVEAYLTAREKKSGPLSPKAREHIIASDPVAIYTLTKTTYEWPGAGDILPEINIPCLIYASDLDPRYPGAEEGAKHIPNATFIPFHGIEHLDILRRGELVLPYVKKFLAELTTNIKE